MRIDETPDETLSKQGHVAYTLILHTPFVLVRIIFAITFALQKTTK